MHTEDNMILGLAHIGLMVSDVNRSKNFYQEILGMEVLHENTIEDETGLINVCFMKKNDLVLEIYQLPQPYKKAEDGAINHIAFKVKDIETVKDALIQKGIQFTQNEIVFCKKLFDRGSKWICFRGPDNESLELNEVL